MKKRYKNYGLWVSVVALVVNVLIYTDVITISESETVTMLANRFLDILALAGIINNPTKPESKGYNL